MKSFKELFVWQKSMQLCKDLFKVTENFPKQEIYGMTSQLRRASVSVCANIAEGHGRNTKGEYRQFIGIANGSLTELETLVILSHEFGYINEDS